MVAISPFSLSHDWAIHWDRLPSNFREGPILGQIAKNEEEALNAIASVGIISSSQMFNLFRLNRNRLKRMVERNRLVQHEIVLNNKQRISLYTLGVNGAKITKLVGYEVNYWVEYTITDVLKRLLFFSFYERFYPVKLLPAIDPFVGTVLINEKPMYVYVLRGDVNDLMMYLKWNHLNERLIIVTESLSFLEQLKPFLHDLQLRVILDHSIMNKEQAIQKSFYLFKNNEFQPEVKI